MNDPYVDTNKIIFTNRDIANLFKSFFTSYDNPIVINGKKTTMSEYLDITFYSFKEDLASWSNFGEFDAESEVENFINSTRKKAYCLVESTNRTVTFAQQLDFETIDGRLTFLIADDKANMLDSFTNCLREKLKGDYHTWETLDSKKYSFYTSLGTLEQLGDTFESPFGKVTILQLDFKIGYLNQAENFTSERYKLHVDTGIEIDLRNVSIIDENYSATNNAVTIINRGGIIGNYISNATMIWNITTYSFSGDDKSAVLVKLARDMISGKKKIDKRLVLSIWEGKEDDDDPQPLYTFNVKLASLTNHKVNSDWDALTITLVLAEEQPTQE